VLLLASTVVAQTINGSLAGTVTDSSGAVLPGARIAVRNLGTGAMREVTTNETGFFRITALPIGSYAVEVTAQGFGKVERKPIAVETAVERTLDFTLSPAAQQEVLVVTEEAPLVEATKAQLSKGVESKRILDLPVTNTLNALALLQPGALPNNNGRPGSGFSINGGRSRSNNFTIDGANNNDQSLSIPRQELPAETVEQFRLITNNFGAEFGRNSGSVVNVITKSGGNAFHGNVRWTWLGNGFNALSTAEQRSFNAQKTAGADDFIALRRSRGVQVQNQGLISGGGPIKKDHSFFYSSYDREWVRSTRVPTTAAISPQGLANLQAVSSQLAPGTLNFLTQTFPAANDPTSRGSINVTVPSGQVVNVPITTLNRGGVSYGTDFYRWLMKVDTKITQKFPVSVRYLIDDLADPGAPTAIPGLEIGTAGRNQSATINSTQVITPTVINEARATYSRRAISFPEKLPASFQITGFNSVGNANFPQFRTDNVWEFTDNISMIRGRHTFKTGANFLRYQLNSFFAPNFRGTVVYPSLQDFLLDRNASFSRYAGTGEVPARTSEFSAFFQDDWRMTPALTVNLGVRYEYTGAPFGYFSNAKPDINNWAPRVGFAWSPRGNNWVTGNGQFVIRGGWSLAYDQVFQNILLNNSRNYPRGVQVALAPTSGQAYWDPARRPPAPTPQQYVALGGNPDLLPLRLYSPNKRIRQPYSQQYSLGVERQFLKDYVFKAFYVGSRAVGLVREVERNLGFQAAAVNANPSVYAGVISTMQPIRNAAGVITSYRVDPTKGSILVGDGLAQSTYHSLQLTGEKRFSHGVQFELNYTYSSFLNDSDDILGGQTNNTLPAVPFNFKLDRGRSGFDVPHRLVANYTWAIPGYNGGRGIWGRVASDWQVSAISTFASGTPFTVLNANNALGILPGQIGTVEGSQRAGFNPSGTPGTGTSPAVANPQFIANPVNSGIIGVLGRNTQRVGGIIATDFVLDKRVRTWGESQNLQFRWELYNLFNHRNFTVIPTNTVNNSTNNTLFLNLGQTNVGGRTMRFTLRYNF
jgi:hypothetical protein